MAATEQGRGTIIKRTVDHAPMRGLDSSGRSCVAEIPLLVASVGNIRPIVDARASWP